MRTEIDSEGREIVITTANSVWFFKDGKFAREALSSEPRPPLDTIEGPQEDGEWKEYDWAYLVTELEDRSVRHYINVLPSGRPEGFRGIESSRVVAMKINKGESNG